MRFTIKDAIKILDAISRPITSVDISTDSKAFQEHWQAIGALGVVLKDIEAQEAEVVGLIGLVDSWPKTCGCGKSYTETQWGALMYIGSVVDEGISFELRGCSCGVTLSQIIECEGTSPLSHREQYATAPCPHKECDVCLAMHGEQYYRVGPGRDRG